MVYNTGNGASLQKLLDKNTNFRKKIMNIILYEIKKKERKTQYFSETTQTTRVD